MGGLLSYPFGYRGRKVLDANKLTESGYYYVDGGSTNVANKIGPLVHFKVDQSTLQIIGDVFSGQIFIRMLFLSGSSWIWSSWKQL